MQRKAKQNKKESIKIKQNNHFDQARNSIPTKADIGHQIKHFKIHQFAQLNLKGRPGDIPQLEQMKEMKVGLRKRKMHEPCVQPSPCIFICFLEIKTKFRHSIHEK